MGFKSVQLQQYPNGSGAPKAEDDEFWSTALDLGIAPFRSHYPALAAWQVRMEELPGYDQAYPPHWKDQAA